MNEDCKFLYEKAIEGRQEFHQNFNYWMNMYAIFNSAMFVGLYTLKASEHFHSSFLELLIILLGLIAGWFWYFSVCGFYRWILSWIGVVKFYEDQLWQNVYLYRMFVHEEKEIKELQGKSDKEKKEKEPKYFYNPFSTQKLTRRFSFLVAVAWTVLLVYFLYGLYLRDSCFIQKWNIIFLKKYCYLIVSGIVVIFTLFVAIGKLKFGCREHLKNSHMHFRHKGIFVEEINKDKK